MRARFLMTLLLFLLSLPGCRAPGDAGQAQEALARYLAHLHQGQYAQAAALYGGSYDVLLDWNPDMERTDQAALLRRGCTVNGLQCLAVAGIEPRPGGEPGTFFFDVSFRNADGSLFVHPVPGDQAGGELAASFPFTVVASGSGYQVLELPVYLP